MIERFEVGKRYKLIGDEQKCLEVCNEFDFNPSMRVIFQMPFVTILDVTDQTEKYARLHIEGVRGGFWGYRKEWFKPFDPSEVTNFKEITHTATMNREVDLLNDTVNLTISLDKTSVELLKKFACLNEETIQSDYYTRYRVKTVLKHNVGSYADLFFIKELMNNGTATFKDNGTDLYAIEREFKRTIQEAYKLLKKEVVKAELKVTTNETNTTVTY